MHSASGARDITESRRLAACQRKWHLAFDGHKNSVTSQLTSLTWDVACFEVFQEAVKHRPDAPEGGKQLNGFVFNMLARTFYKSVMSDVRKLNDNRKGSVSLRRLLEDIKKDSSLLTRRRVFECEGIVYDCAKLIQAEEDYFEQQRQEGETYSHGASYSQSSERAIARHEQFDFLCGVDSTTRQPNDRIPRSLFSNLISQMDQACTDIKSHVDHFIAHAADDSNLAKAAIVDLTWGDLRKAHRELCKIAGFLSLYILGVSQRTFFALHGGDPLMYLSNPLATKDDIPKIRERYITLESEFRELSEWRPVVSDRTHEPAAT